MTDQNTSVNSRGLKTFQGALEGNNSLKRTDLGKSISKDYHSYLCEKIANLKVMFYLFF